MTNKPNLFINFLRSIAILLVFLGHYLELKFNLNNIAGVDIFFVLSGYLVSKSLFNFNEYLLFRQVKIFITNRLAKIYPSYLVFLFISISYLYFFDFNVNDIPIVSEWKQYLFFYRNYGGPPARFPFEHLWSLSCEMQFYIILLITSLLFKNSKTLFYIWLSIYLISVLWKLQAIFTLWAEWPTYTHNRIDAFALGVLYYIRPKYYLNKSYLITALIIFVFMIFQIINFEIDNHRLINRIITPILVYLLLIQKIEIRNTIVNAVSFQIAKYSYNLYLWHYLVLYVLSVYYSLNFVYYVVISSIAAIFFTHFIELPFLKRFKIHSS